MSDRPALTVADVQERVARIAAVTRDPEIAHGEEDSLWRDVLEAIAHGAPEPAALAREALRTAEGLPWPGNLWLGTSIENNDVRHRADTLRKIPAAVRFISAEPLLGPLTLDLTGIHWLIAGAESGAGNATRPMSLEWVRSLRDQCVAAGVAFFYKQDATPGGVKLSLPMLDGRSWTEMPGRGEVRTPTGAGVGVSKRLTKNGTTVERTDHYFREGHG